MAFIGGKPHLNIELSKDMDIWAVKEFLSFDDNDMFSNTILTLNPELEKARDLDTNARENYYITYIDKKYIGEDIFLNETKADLVESWNHIEDQFLEATRKLFNNHPWPQGSYVGFLSIFNCNPRFLNQKTFQCYYKHDEGLVYVCAHEMLHFMFYDYIDTHNQLKDDATESQIWNLSEIFNVVLLGTSTFSEITKNKNPKPYPKHEDLIGKFSDLWKSTQDVDAFISKTLELL